MELCCFSVINMKTTLQAFTFIYFQHRYRHTDATDFLMFSLAPMLPMFDVRCANRPNSRKMIIKAAKRIFNSDKICRSYSDLHFGVTFLEHSVN